MEIRRLLQYPDPTVPENEVASNYINDNILRNKNILIPRLFNKIWEILISIKENTRPMFYETPQTIRFAVGNQSYSGEIIKRLTTPKLKRDIFEVKIDHHPEYYRILFIIEKAQPVSFVLFTFGYTKIPTVIDFKTNFYSLLSDGVSNKCHTHKKGVDYQ